MKEGEYVLATKWHDGDPLDQWCVGFFKGMLPKGDGERYEVVDSKEVLFRRNGFRRCKRISTRRGKFLLENMDNIQNGCRSLWWWNRCKMGNE